MLLLTVFMLLLLYLAVVPPCCEIKPGQGGLGVLYDARHFDVLISITRSQRAYSGLTHNQFLKLHRKQCM